MSAETLRRAAALMRERAEVATEGPWAWEATSDNDNGWCLGVVWDENDRPLSGRVESDQGEVVDQVCELMFASHYNDAEHIASWHPLVADAVAELLDGLAADTPWDFRHDEALAVARAYLGETS